MANTKGKILVVDDEASLLHSIVAYLEDSGFVVYGAENGVDAWELYQQNQPDLVLTDIHMPQMSGLDLLGRVTKQQDDYPVIVISGAGQLSDAIEALRLGAWDYITKPIVDLHVLEHAIDKALERKRLIQENKNYAQQIEKSLKELKEDQIAGRKVQMSLLPPNQLKIENYSFGYKIIPSLELSGDFVEYFALDQNLYIAYIADVSGHGSSSAFITVLLKSLIARFKANYQDNNDDSIINPEKILKILSEEIYQAKLSKYITIVYAVLDCKNNKLRYAIGGHYPNPILLKSNGKVEYLEGRGFPVGIQPDATYQVHEINIEAGESLIMFTDGIMEQIKDAANMEDKEARLLQVIKDSNSKIEPILNTLGVAAQQTAPIDDITILTIARS